MKLLSTALLGYLTSGVVAHLGAPQPAPVASHVDQTLEEARRRNPPKCKGPKCPRPCKGPNCPGKAPSKKAPAKKAPPKKGKAPPKRAPPPKKGKAPPPKRGKAPPKKGKAPPKCKGPRCPKPCKGPNCAGNKQAAQQGRPQGLKIINERHFGTVTLNGEPVPVPADPEPHFTDDVFYPKPLLQKMAAAGTDVSGMKAIKGMYSAEHAAQQRGLTQHTMWTERDPVDNKIVVPYTFHADYPAAEKAAAIAAYDKMNNDLGCIKTKYIDESLVSPNGAPHTNGIIIAWQDITGNGCYSALGRAPGFNGRSPFTITELGAPSGWQLMSYGDMATSSCSGLDEGTLHHEMLHALGVKHEHSRPDREQYLIVDLNKASDPSQFTLIDTNAWIQVFDDAGNDRFPYEATSVMHYCSACGAKNPADPVMTYQDGTTFGSGDFMTTTDSLQIIWQYCDVNGDQGNPKETIQCQSNDKFNLARPVYVDRVCDGRFDCLGGEDELGGMATCIPEATLDSGCCASLWVNGVEFVHKQDFNNHGTWEHPDDPLQVVMRWSDGTWYRATNGLPGNEGGFSYRALSSGVNPANAACPPIDTTWQTFNGDPYSVLCKSSSAQFSEVNECADGSHNCDPLATCTDQLALFTCTCPETHSGDGTTCEEIILVDECATNNGGCPEVCVDKIEGFECQCQEGQFDQNNDGQTCIDVDTCCEVFKIGLDWPNYRLLCTHERTHAGTGMMDYNCEADPDVATPSSVNFPAAVQFITNTGSPMYYLTTNQGVLPDAVVSGQFSLLTSSEAPVGAICPSMDGAAWQEIAGQSWNVECVTWVQEEEPADPDQCSDGTHNCHQEATCTNTDDGFTCACEAGLTGDGVTSCVQLVDECSTGAHNCDANAFCTNTDAAFSCICNDGFDGDGFTCTQHDVNECEDGSHQCSEVAQCINNSGSYTCACPTTGEWTQVSDLVCEDVDECLQNACSTSNSNPSVCTNASPGFSCSCAAGYEESPNSSAAQFVCTDINECTQAAACGANSVCTNLDGSHTCECVSGFEKDGAGECVDKNECNGANQCSGEGVAGCNNLVGDYECTCSDGFTQSTASNKQCVDVDECAQDKCLIQLANPATCTNSVGSYTCTCNDGFEKMNDLHECADIDECSPNIDMCNIAAGVPAQCFNFQGGYECECDTGYTASTDQINQRQLGFACNDVDECTMASGVCANNPNSSCVNTDGGFECACADGFSADATGICTDANECENFDCGPTAECVNIEGGFECRCKLGYEKDGAGQCVDQDECLDVASCFLHDGNAATCTNTEGSFECNCNAGYLVDDNGWCNDIDECNLFRMRVSCSANTDCTNTEGSFECTCKDGFIGEQRNFGTICMDQDECADATLNNCPSSTDCTNTFGSYECSCPTGTTNVCEQADCFECVADDPCAVMECGDGFTCQETADGTAFCQDIDECATGGVGGAFCAEADPNGVCKNTPGSYECACADGTVDTDTSAEGLTCESLCAGSVTTCAAGTQCEIVETPIMSFVQCVDIDECLPGNGGDVECSADAGLQCVNMHGSFTCECATGFVSTSAGCQSPCDAANCPENSTCNMDALGTAQCECNSGFMLSETPNSELICKSVCDDLNCPADSTCETDLLGVTECVCPAGSTLSVDANSELFCEANDPCLGVTCEHLAGSTCNAAGECECTNNRVINKNANHQEFCDHFNPCEQMSCEEVGDNLVCVTAADFSAQCVCAEGFEDVGGVCTELDLCAKIVCDAGYQCTAGECTDIDECATNSASCRFFENCINTDGSFTCEMDQSHCDTPNITPSPTWKGSKYGRVFYKGDVSAELRVTVLNNDENLEVRDAAYYGFLMFGKKRCGSKFLDALATGAVGLDIHDLAHVYNIADVYKRDDKQASTTVMFHMFDPAPIDEPVKKDAEVKKKDQFYVNFWNFDSADFGNKDWQSCLETVTVGVLQSSDDVELTNACAAWNKTLWN